MKPLTIKDFNTIKEGTKLLCLESYKIYGIDIKKNSIYTFTNIKNNTHITLKETDNYGFKTQRFALAGPPEKRIAYIANRGRRAANILLKRYADKLEIKDGLYIIKPSFDKGETR